MKYTFKINRKMRVALIILILCSITIISCSGSNIKQKDGRNKNLISTVVPGQEEITFNDTGKYTIYLQIKGELNGKDYSISEDIQGLNFKIYNKEKNINVHAPKGESSLTIGSNTYIGIFEFQINKVGTYTLESNSDNAEIQNVGIKIEKSNIIFITILKVFAVFLCIIIGILIFIFKTNANINKKIKTFLKNIKKKNIENNIEYLEKPKKVSRVIFLIPTIIGIVSWIVAIGILISSILSVHNMVDNTDNVLVPGRQDINIEESGEYEIYIQPKGVVDGKLYIVPNNITGIINCRVYNKDTHEEIALNKLKSGFDSESKDIRKGIFKFKVEQGGTYIFESELLNSDVNNIVLSIENSSLVFRFIFKVIYSTVIWLIGNCIWIIGFLMVKSKNKKYEQEFNSRYN